MLSQHAGVIPSRKHSWAPACSQQRLLVTQKSWSSFSCAPCCSLSSAPAATMSKRQSMLVDPLACHGQPAYSNPTVLLVLVFSSPSYITRPGRRNCYIYCCGQSVEKAQVQEDSPRALPQRAPAHEELALGRAVACDEEAAPPDCKAVTRAGSAWSSSPFCQLNKGGKSRPAHSMSSSFSN